MRILTLSLSFAGLAISANACSCMPSKLSCQAAWEADAVFVGRVKEVMPFVSSDGHLQVAVYLRQIETFRGPAGSKVIVTGAGGSDCGYNFTRGEKYLVYAYTEKDGRLHTNICTRTKVASGVSGEIDYLRGLPTNRTGGVIFGFLVREDRPRAGASISPASPLTNIKVSVAAEGLLRGTTTDAKGYFSFGDLPPGEYDVVAHLPPTLEELKERVQMRFGSCRQLNWQTRADGQVRGRILDHNGKPYFDTVMLNLVPATSEEPRGRIPSFWESSDPKTGEFKFTGVPPGKYMVGVSVNLPPNATFPYSLTFASSVNEGGTRLINMGEGGRAEVVLRLPKPNRTRSIELQVAWPDGKPAVGARTYAHDPRYPGQEAVNEGVFETIVRTNTSGQSIITLLEGVEYWVHGEILVKDRDWVCAPPVYLKAGKERTRLLLILAERLPQPSSGCYSFWTKEARERATERMKTGIRPR